MKLKCIDGPMNGAIYVLDRHESNTTRKPDGFWFDSFELGRIEYAFDRLADEGDHVTLCFRHKPQEEKERE